LLSYIVDRCDNAGFFEINKKLLRANVSVNEERLRECFSEIKKAYIMSVDKKTIWIRNFLKHQRKLPLKANSKIYNQIIKTIRHNIVDVNRFPKNKEISSLLPVEFLPIALRKKESDEIEPRFKKPTLEEVVEHMKFKELPNHENEAISFFNFYESKGWKIGRNSMKSWKSAIDGTWAKSIRERNKDKFSILEKSHKEESLDWNNIYNEE
jgi:hypothetical protein